MFLWDMFLVHSIFLANIFLVCFWLVFLANDLFLANKLFLGSMFLGIFGRIMCIGLTTTAHCRIKP